jgi:hypothetical protein
MISLFKNEKVITTTDSNIIILTTHRVRHTSRGSWGNRHKTSIMLEKISSIQATYISYPMLLVAGALLAFGGAMLNTRDGANGSGLLFGAAAILLISYFVTRRQACIIASDGGAKIAFGTTNMDKELLSEFIDKVEGAKNDRTTQLK